MLVAICKEAHVSLFNEAPEFICSGLLHLIFSGCLLMVTRFRNTDKLLITLKKMVGGGGCRNRFQPLISFKSYFAIDAILKLLNRRRHKITKAERFQNDN